MLVTAIMPTANRREYLPGAIQSFLDQAYSEKELLILDDGDSICDIVPLDSRIRNWFHSPRQTIGAKRNDLCTRARGEIILHWDDDDYSAPGRIADQVERLLSTGADVTGYNEMEFREDRTGERWYYTGPAHYALGTSLCYRRSWWERNKFLDMGYDAAGRPVVGEDNSFVYRANAFGKLVAVPAGGMMWARIHPGNTSPRATHSPMWRRLA